MVATEVDAGRKVWDDSALGVLPVCGIYAGTVLLTLGDTEMNPDKVIVRYEQVDEQVEGPVRRIIGFVKAKNMLALFDAADLEANPRSAKAGPVTEAIIESI